MVMAAHAGGQITSEPKGTRTPVDRSTIRGRSIMDAATVQMPDVLALDPTEYGLAHTWHGHWDSAPSCPHRCCAMTEP